VLCVAQFDVGLRGVIVCYVWESLLWIWGSDFVLCVREFVVCLGQ